MAIKAEVERTTVDTLSRHLWFRVIRMPALKGVPWEAVPYEDQAAARRVARWHLRKVKAAEKVASGAGYSKGYWAGRRVSNGKED